MSSTDAADVPDAAGDLTSRLDDPDYPAYTTGQAAAALGVRQAFLRSLDAARAVRPQRSAGGHRRYSRRQLLFAQRVRELFDQGHTLTSALRILSLEDELAAARALIARLRGQLGSRHEPPGATTGPTESLDFSSQETYNSG
ncbi:MAG TPA: helix-turn-helix domain-containing protein [Streptosporangiaceae bacterium]|nr:helix-turn-helix domain-containing protein [Streptosporangiaceae bacterium]